MNRALRRHPGHLGYGFDENDRAPTDEPRHYDDTYPMPGGRSPRRWDRRVRRYQQVRGRYIVHAAGATTGVDCSCPAGDPPL